VLGYCDITQAEELRETTITQDCEGPEGPPNHHNLGSPRDMTNPTYASSHTVTQTQTDHLSLGISSPGTAVQVPSVAHRRAVLEGSRTSSPPTPHVFTEQAGFPKPSEQH